MNLNVILVPPGQVTFWITRLTKYLRESAQWSHGRCGVDDIVRFVINGQMQCWVVVDNDFEPYGYAVTEIKSYPQNKMLVVQYLAGEANHMQYVEDKMFGLLDKFARDGGCAGIEFFGRPGWIPHAKKYGYKVKSVVHQKFFGEDQ